MLENLSEKLKGVIKNIKGHGKLTEENINQITRELRLALLEADVNYTVVKEFINAIKEKALGEEVRTSLKPSEIFIKIVKDELTELLGKQKASLDINSKPSIIMLVGLQGGGKTTTVGKLANLIRKKHKKNPLLVACDVYRPAAVDQLAQIGKELGIDVYKEEIKDPVTIAKNALKYATENKNDVIFIDTAGRLHIDDELMDELKQIVKEIKPQEILLIIDSMMGQDAINVIKGFDEKLMLTGAILTKLDGDTKGGVALSVRHLTNIPIKYIGTSEKMDGIEEFYPDRMASRILGMGDLMTMVEKVESVIDKEEADKTAKNFKKGKFDLEDFLSSLKQIKKLGPLEGIVKMIPGMSDKIPKGTKVDEKQLVHIEAIIQSMTPGERANPSILKASRKKRIASGSGRNVMEVNRLLKQFEEMQKMIKQVKSGNFKLPF